VNLWGEWPWATPGHAFGLFLALVLGALIGLERALRKHPAGLHTSALVALGSAAFVVAGTLVGDASGPARATVRGLNTAATVWCCSAVGVLAGVGLNAWAILTALLVLAANLVLHVCEHRISESNDK
jgi:putative Mg2+ transporter-C (MgtC) family protein